MSGSPPFVNFNARAQIILRIVQEEYPTPAEHPTLDQNDPLWSLMRRCWAREPRMRPTISDVEFGVSASGRNNHISRTYRADLVSTL